MFRPPITTSSTPEIGRRSLVSTASDFIPEAAWLTRQFADERDQASQAAAAAPATASHSCHDTCRPMIRAWCRSRSKENAYPNGTCGSHLAQSELRGANYTLGAALYLFSNSAIIDRCSSGEAFCIFAAAALWAASPFLICSMTCSRHFFPISTNEFPVISTSHAPPSSLHVNFFILLSSLFLSG